MSIRIIEEKDLIRWLDSLYGIIKKDNSCDIKEFTQGKHNSIYKIISALIRKEDLERIIFLARKGNEQDFEGFKIDYLARLAKNNKDILIRPTDNHEDGVIRKHSGKLLKLSGIQRRYEYMVWIFDTEQNFLIAQKENIFPKTGRLLSRSTAEKLKDIKLKLSHNKSDINGRIIGIGIAKRRYLGHDNKHSSNIYWQWFGERIEKPKLIPTSILTPKLKTVITPHAKPADTPIQSETKKIIAPKMELDDTIITKEEEEELLTPSAKLSIDGQCKDLTLTDDHSGAPGIKPEIYIWEITPEGRTQITPHIKIKDNGSFKISGLHEGHYIIGAKLTDFIPYKEKNGDFALPLKTDNQMRTIINLKDHNVSGIIIALKKKNIQKLSISGHVKDFYFKDENKAKGIPDAKIRLYDASEIGPGRIIGIKETFTDANGQFHIENIMPGKYYLAAYHEEYEPTGPTMVDGRWGINTNFFGKPEGVIMLEKNRKDLIIPLKKENMIIPVYVPDTRYQEEFIRRIRGITKEIDELHSEGSLYWDVGLKQRGLLKIENLLNDLSPEDNQEKAIVGKESKAIIEHIRYGLKLRRGLMFSNTGEHAEAEIYHTSMRDLKKDLNELSSSLHKDWDN